MIPSHLASYTNAQHVLDHGHVRLVDFMGDDQAIVQAARVSYGLGMSEHKLEKKGYDELLCTVCDKTFAYDSPELPKPQKAGDIGHCAEGDRRLIRYLYRHRHTTPLEMCEIKLHIKMPIFVARQWIRHRTASVNEYSMRYSPAIEEFYLIAAHEWREQSSSNKQGSDGNISAAYGRGFTANSKKHHADTLREYQAKIEHGVAKEIARCDLPLSMYTEWYWKIDLHNLLHFLSLRLDPHAQLEIRVYAEAIGKIVAQWVPYAWEAFNDFHPNRGAHTFSAQEMDVIRILAGVAEEYLAAGQDATLREMYKQVLVDKGLSARERKGFWEALNLL